MNKKNVLFLLTYFISAVNIPSYAMDVDQHTAIPLNNGLLTMIEGTISQTGFTTFGFSRHITGTNRKTDIVINLLRYQQDLDNSKGAGPVELFCPIIFKVDKDNYIEDLGQFNPKTHLEAKEAIRQNKALYLPAGQGAIIYSLDTQPKPECLLTLHKKLKAKIDRKAAVTIPDKK